MEASGGALHADIRRVAFRFLLRSGSPAQVMDLAAGLGLPAEDVGVAVRELQDRGAVRVDGRGRVVGSSGLSVQPDRHRIELGARTLWTWCAYDFVGIFGALRATGTAHTRDPLSGTDLVVAFESGSPRRSTVVLFRPDERFRDACTNVYEQWCPNSNLFETAGAARTWAADHELEGRVLTLAEATALASEGWRPLVEGLDL
jgi:hypothetical protein